MAIERPAFTFGSLFSGIGGFDLGLELAGMRCRFQVEIDAACQQVLCQHWPQMERFADVREVHAIQLPVVDLLCGGFPCQDLSIAGKRAGLGGARSALFYEFARLIEEIRPSWVLIENVPGLLSSQEGRDMGSVLGTLAELGYGFSYRVLDAQFFGVPQRRRRVFIAGHLGSLSAAAQVLFECSGLCWSPTPGYSEEAQAFCRAGASTPARGKYSAPILSPNGKGELLIPKISRTLVTSQGPLDSTLIPAIPEGGEDDESLLASVRRLTPRECERLQGFPDDWTAGQSDSRRYRQLGNAVCVPVAEWIGKRTLSVAARTGAPDVWDSEWAA